ncbi:MAG: ROK family protein, partial [Candidatus Sulfotelmatobacter sp.]
AKAASSDPEFGAQSIYNLAMHGDEPSRRIFHTFGRYLGIMLAGIVNILNLDMYVLGGGVLSAWDAFAPTMFEELRARSLVYAATAPDNPLMTPNDSSQKEKGREESGASLEQESSTVRKTIITRAQLGSDAGLYGAAHVAAVSN